MAAFQPPGPPPQRFLRVGVTVVLSLCGLGLLTAPHRMVLNLSAQVLDHTTEPAGVYVSWVTWCICVDSLLVHGLLRLLRAAQGLIPRACWQEFSFYRIWGRLPCPKRKADKLLSALLNVGR